MDILFALLLMMILLPFVINKLADQNRLFTRLQSGDIKYIMRGETLARIIHDVRGKKLVRVDGRDIFQDLEPGETPQTNWFNRRTGLWWVGLPPFARVHEFNITVEREHLDETDPNKWVQREKDRKVSELRFTFPRPYLLRNIETSDGLSVDLLIITKQEVVDPYIPVFNLKGKFFENAGGIIEGGVKDIVNTKTLRDMILLRSGEGKTSLLAKLKQDANELNQELVAQVGLRLVGISIAKVDPSDKELRNALQAKELAIQRGEGKIAEAEAEAKATVARANGEAAAEERLAVARGVRIRETVVALAGTNGDPSVIAQQAGKILQAEALTSKDSKVTTWVDGGGQTPVVIQPK